VSAGLSSFGSAGAFGFSSLGSGPVGGVGGVVVPEVVVANGVVVSPAGGRSEPGLLMTSTPTLFSPEPLSGNPAAPRASRLTTLVAETTSGSTRLGSPI